MKTSGNTILITGGSSGIGFEFAKQLLALDNTVIATGRDAKKLEKAKALLPKLNIIKSDVGQPAEIEALLAKVLAEFPKLNVMLNKLPSEDLVLRQRLLLRGVPEWLLKLKPRML